MTQFIVNQRDKGDCSMLKNSIVGKAQGKMPKGGLLLNTCASVHVYNDDNDNATLLFYIAFIIHKALSNTPSLLI